MQKSYLCILSLALFAASPGVWADDGSAGPFYVGFDLGHVSVSRGSLSLTPSSSGGIDGSATSVTLSAGYDINSFLGLELAYHNFGRPTAFLQGGSMAAYCPQAFSCPHLTGLTAELVGRYELVPALDGELRMGVLGWQASAPAATLLQETSGGVFIYGLGVVHHFDYGLNLEITYERSTFTTEETRIGLSYSF